MSEIKYTPGPWEYDTDKKGYGCEFSGFAVHGGGYTVATVITDTESLSNAANAKLIAAAPELLEALTALRDAVDNYFGPSKSGAAWPKYFDPEMHAAWAALRKATGE